MIPAFPDNDNDRIPGIPLGEWLMQIPGIAADWPRGVLSVGGEGQTPAFMPAAVLSHEAEYDR